MKQVRWAIALLCFLPIACGQSTPLQIISITYLGQSPIAPEMLSFSCTFQSGHNPMGLGSLRVRSGSFSQEISLIDIFLRNKLDPYAKSGTFEFSVALSLDDPGMEQVGRRFELRFQLRDRLSQVSNVWTTSLQIAKKGNP